MPEVELAIGSSLVTIEHERMDTRLEYRDRFTGSPELLTIPSELFYHAKSIFRNFEIVFNLFYIRIAAISKRIYLIAVCLFDPQQTFANPL